MKRVDKSHPFYYIIIYGTNKKYSTSIYGILGSGRIMDW